MVDLSDMLASQADQLAQVLIVVIIQGLVNTYTENKGQFLSVQTDTVNQHKNLININILWYSVRMQNCYKH